MCVTKHPCGIYPGVNRSPLEEGDPCPERRGCTATGGQRYSVKHKCSRSPSALFLTPEDMSCSWRRNPQ